MEITGIKVLDNIINDYKNDLEVSEKYRKCMNELKSLDRSKVRYYYTIYIFPNTNVNIHENYSLLCVNDINKNVFGINELFNCFLTYKNYELFEKDTSFY